MKTKTYTVYHIPGIKFGCTSDYKSRSKDNRKQYGPVEIYKFLITSDIKLASDVEMYYNKLSGYKTNDTKPYSDMVEMAITGGHSVIDRKGTFEKGNIPFNKNKKHLTGYKWMYLNENTTRVKSDEQKSYLEKGYKFGRPAFGRCK